MDEVAEEASDREGSISGGVVASDAGDALRSNGGVEMGGSSHWRSERSSNSTGGAEGDASERARTSGEVCSGAACLGLGGGGGGGGGGGESAAAVAVGASAGGGVEVEAARAAALWSCSSLLCVGRTRMESLTRWSCASASVHATGGLIEEVVAYPRASLTFLCERFLVFGIVCVWCCGLVVLCL